MRTLLVSALLGASVVTAMLACPSEAAACGGCFHPPPAPTETPSVITDHRMVFSIARDQTTLYDQIRFNGNPSSFAWVLPIVGQVKVGLSSDAMFNALDGATQTVIQGPEENCPPRPSNCNNRGGLFGSAADNSSAPTAGGSSADAGVSVLKEEVVGPYETVQLRSTDPNALVQWLTDHKFTIQDDIKPVVQQYVAEHFDFLALKLVPGTNVKAMRPVSVTTVGASPVLPLRMVAAGTGATVGVTLWVIAEGRYEPQNFPFFHVETDEIAWDWAQKRSNYTDLRKGKADASKGRAWEIESSVEVSKSVIESQLNFSSGPVSGGDAGSQQYGGYAPEDDGQGNQRPAQQVFQNDMDTLFGKIPGGSVRVTRIRSDLAHAALSEDLLIRAANDQATLPNFRKVTKEIGEPLCPVWNGCDQAGVAPRSEAAAKSKQLEDTALWTCATSGRDSVPSLVGLGSLAAFAALAFARSRRKSGRGDQ